MSGHGLQVSAGERFEFGANWARFLKVLDEERIALAEQSLRAALGVTDLKGKSFLDIGSGSGLFSLAARRLGARVRSFDYDPQSVACTEELRRRYFPNDQDWTVEEGSVLDRCYLKTLGEFDIVYSWGVLHHTGAMWQALENVLTPLSPGGLLFISIYNDQGVWSSRWLRVKRTYNRLPPSLKAPFTLIVMGLRELKTFAWAIVRFRPLSYFRLWSDYARDSVRGMSRWHDLIDWVGGYPFEVAKPEQVFDFFRKRGLELTRLKTCGGGLGCNEYVFVDRNAPTSARDGTTG